MGPMSNAPIDTIKTRIQRGASADGSKGLKRIMNVARDLVAKEGLPALYKGITPRVLRVAPGQAVTFAVYEKVSFWVEQCVCNIRSDTSRSKVGWRVAH